MRNYISVNLSKLFNSLIGFLTQYFLIRIFNPSDVGFITYLASISSIFFYLSDLGLTNFSRRFLPSLKSNLIDFYSYVGIIFLKKFILLFIFSFMFLLTNILFKLFDSLEFMIIIIATFNLTINSKFIFESKSNFVFFSIFETSIKILSFLMIILFTYFHLNNFYSYFLILNLIQLLSGIILIYYFFSKVNKLDLKKLFDFSEFTKSLPYLIPSIYAIVYGSLDRILLINLIDSDALFIHSQAIFITTHLITFSTSLSSVNSPESNKVYSEGNMNRFIELIKSTSKNINIISYPIIIGFSILMLDFSPLFFNLFSNQIRITSSVLIWDILFNGFFYLQMEQILLGMRKIFHFNMVLIISTFLLIPIYLLLIPLTGYYGPSLSIIIGRIIAVLITDRIIIKFSLPKITYIKFRYLFFSIIMGIVVLFVRILITNSLYSIVIQILTGVIVYSLLIFLFDKSSIRGILLKKFNSND